MPQPNKSQIHVDAPLTNISVAYIQSQEHFIADKVFPIVPVEKQTDKYFTYTKADWFRDEAQRRGNAQESAGSGYNMSTGSYSCDVFALHKDIGNQDLANADAPIDMEGDAAKFVAQRLLLRREVQWATDFFATSVWGTDSTPAKLWSDKTSSDPISDIETGSQTILTNTGFLPNTLVLGDAVYRQLRHHPDIVDRVKYTSEVASRNVTPAVLAQLFDVERVLVARAVQNTAVEGETAVYSMVHGKHALLCHVTDSPSLLAPSAGYMFSWRGVSGGLGADIGVKRIDVPLKDATRVEGQVAFDNKVVASDLGYFFASAVA